MIREPSTAMKIYILFLFLVCIVTSVKLVRVWRAAPPLRLSRQASSPTYLQLLETSSRRLTQWMVSTFLAWGLFASISLTHVCNQLLNDKRMGQFVILFVIQDLSTTLTMALVTVLFSFLVRWHMLKRIEYLRLIPS